MNSQRLKNLLDTLYLQYKRKFSSKDPVWVLHRFRDEKDVEVIGLITSAYAYGQVDLINKFIEKLLARIGRRPFEFTINFSKRKDKKYLKGLNYRFNTDTHLVNLFQSMKDALIAYGSIQNLFLKYYKPESENISDSLAGFMTNLRNGHPDNFLIPGPEKASTCKRMNLFLRWMVRKDEIDTGIWNKIDKSKLIMPVDVHIARISKKLRLVERKTIDMKFALELTKKLREFDNSDPVKYDFSLCHIGIDRRFASGSEAIP